MPDEKKSNKNFIISLLTIVAVIVIDQLTKLLSVKLLKPIDTFPIIKDVLHLTYLQNKGAAFGMLADKRWVFMVLSSVAIVLIIIVLARYSKCSLFFSISCAFLVGGGVGNMIDRLLYGYVVDFIDFRLINFAVFNGADSFVCVGAVMLVVYFMFFDKSILKDNQK